MNIFVVQAIAMAVIVGTWIYMLVVQVEDDSEVKKWIVLCAWGVSVAVLIGSIGYGLIYI